MTRFLNDETKVVVSVADDKADRFTSGWTELGDEGTEPAKRTRRTAAKSTDDDKK